MNDKLPSAKFPPYHTKTYQSIDLINHGIDVVNSPPHYTKGKYEAIDIIEDAIQYAPNAVLGSAQGQVLKYVSRLWHKSNALEDAKKARWYLNRLIDKLERNENTSA